MTMMQTQTIAGTKKACCEEDKNLRVVESNLTMTVRRCIICGCRHYEATLLPGKLVAQSRS